MKINKSFPEDSRGPTGLHDTPGSPGPVNLETKTGLNGSVEALDWDEIAGYLEATIFTLQLVLNRIKK
jgi:hypothetical protein